jgi:hypothetical protein
VDAASAEVVGRIFRLYLEGQSFDNIAHQFNIEHVPSPRAKTHHGRKGWVATSVRSILENPAYVGEWSFKQKEWVRVPGQKRRVYRKRPESEIIRQTFPERRIIDAETWDAVQIRLTEITDRLARSTVPELATFRATLLRWRREVLAYFRTRATNGMTEGFNGKAKLVKRRAYGYRSFLNYRLRLLNACP